VSTKGGGGADQDGSRARGTPSSSRSAAGLNPKQARFVAEYLKDLNATQAAIRAGYSKKTAGSQAHDLLKKPEISLLVAQGQQAHIDRAIATRAERQKFWTKIMQDAGEDLRDRLKASELLGKSEADFTEKVELSGRLTLEELVAGSIPTDEVK
jgi:phage terminase small subunit